jgi:HEAT repeat protein
MPEPTPKSDAQAFDAGERAAEMAALGLGAGHLDGHAMRELRVRVESDPDARVRIAALGALARRAPKARAQVAWRYAARDHDSAVRRRACELAPLLDTPATRATLVTQISRLLDDDDALVAEAAAFAIGELASRGDELPQTAAVAALVRATTTHVDPLVREAAVAALGAIGDPESLDAVLAATHDKPAIRRRAVLALAAFEGPAVEAAIAAALTDTDWQVRQAAEDLSN